jgi:predicted nuclease of restriction endonuclease-like (RecB) superfamily
MVETYWNIGKNIVEEEQQGKQRADYGKQLITELSVHLAQEFGAGFSEQNLWNMRQFFLSFPILYTLSRELSWSHYNLIMRVSNPKAREWYMQESAHESWSVRTLKRQITSLSYDRLLSHQTSTTITNDPSPKTNFSDIVRDPLVLEFLNIPTHNQFSESQLEQSIINNLQQFLLELGKGFAFVARQKRISTETKHFYIDLVFYNYLARCFVVIDLKTDELSYQDIGQIDMYTRVFDEKHRLPNDNPTIGIILTTQKDKTIVKYSVLNDNPQLFSSVYQLYMPTELELQAYVENTLAHFK